MNILIVSTYTILPSIAGGLDFSFSFYERFSKQTPQSYLLEPQPEQRALQFGVTDSAMAFFHSLIRNDLSTPASMKSHGKISSKERSRMV
jgi:hypothetical protein